jgi:pyruvate,water dikinase
MDDRRMSGTTPPPVVALSEAAAHGPAVVGSKAHTLARLSSAGFPVPGGFVVTHAALTAWERTVPQVRDAVATLGAGAFAVRSSGAAEDLPGASFAGQYDTVLDVEAAGVPAAVRAVFDSATGPRVSSYLAASGHPQVLDTAMAVLVQPMIAADVSGVAFTADPLTGRRDEALVTAVHGVAERLVSGEVEGDEWTVRARSAVRRRRLDDVIDARLAVEVATLGRRVAQWLGCPQDIEWAVAEGALYLLQARPMTALPDPVSWDAPGPGRWMRNFRVGEWLADPMTPLFATWLLPRLEQGLHDAMRKTAGAVLPFRSAAVNGWYYTALPHPPLPSIVTAVWHSRGRLIPFARDALVRVNRRPEVADRALLGDLTRQWCDEHLPRYRRAVSSAEAEVERATIDELVRLVDALGHEAGAQLWWLELLGGSAWKIEACLARFVDRHLPGVLDQGVPRLLGGLRPVRPVPAHAVQSLDWYHPTAGELEMSQLQGPAERPDAAAARKRAEDACRSALDGRPVPRARFDTLLEVAQRYAALREEQAHQLTLAWPVLRRCALRLGDHERAQGRIADQHDVFFLARAQITTGTNHHGEVEHRRAVWERQRRLIAPLAIGRPPRLLPDVVERAVARIRRAPRGDGHALVGQPASPGRATGPVRVVRGPDDFLNFAAGEVLVARTTAPAWTPLFAAASAVVTDGGTLAAHASLVAREYGIPAVVATGDATVRLRNGQTVTVDGSAGVVETTSHPDAPASGF